MSDESTASETPDTSAAPEADATPDDASASTDTGAADALGASEAGSEGGDVAGDAVAQAHAADEAASERWVLKYDGKDHEVTDKNELLKLAQKGLGADKRFEEAAATKKEAQATRQQIEAAARRMAEDPISVLAALHGDEGKAAQVAARRMMAHPATRAEIERLMIEALEYDAMPEAERKAYDEQRTLRERAAAADRYEAAERKRAEEAEEAKRTEAQQAEVTRLKQTFAEEARVSLTAAGLDPDDPDTAERWIMQRISAREHGVEMTAAEAAQRVAAKVGASRKATLENLSKLEGQALLDALGPLAAKVRAADAARLQNGQRAAARKTQTGGAASKPRPPKREYSADRYARAMRELGVAETHRRMDAGESLDP